MDGHRFLHLLPAEGIRRFAFTTRSHSDYFDSGSNSLSHHPLRQNGAVTRSDGRVVKVGTLSVR